MVKLHRPGGWATGAVVALCALLVLLTALVVFFWTTLHPPAAAPDLPPACDSCCSPCGSQALYCGQYAPQGTYSADLGEVQGIPAPFGGTINPLTLIFHPSGTGSPGTVDLHAEVNMTAPVSYKDALTKDYKGIPYTYDPHSCVIAFDPASTPMKTLAQYGGTLSDVLYDAHNDRVLGRVRLKHTFTINLLIVHQTLPLDLDQKMAFAYTGPKKPPRQVPGAGSPGSPGAPPRLRGRVLWSAEPPRLQRNNAKEKMRTAWGGTPPRVFGAIGAYSRTRATLLSPYQSRSPRASGRSCCRPFLPAPARMRRLHGRTDESCLRDRGMTCGGFEHSCARSALARPC